MTSQPLANISALLSKARQYLSLKKKVFSDSLTPTFPDTSGWRSASTQKCRDKQSEPTLEKITEKFIYYLWAEQPIKDLNYRTTDNKRIKIVSTGLWNSNPGPDFTGATIYLGDQLYKGDIEIHLYSSDWTRHQHHLDNRYNNLILHITLWDDTEKPIKLNNGLGIPQMVLGELFREKLEDIEKLLELDISLKQGSYFTSPGRCYSYIKQAPAQKTVWFLEGAGESRLLRKVENLQTRLSKSCNNYDSVLYQGIMGALGYRNNQLAFLQLSETVPYKKIQQIIKQYPQDKRPLVIQSVLLNTAGLKPQTCSDGAKTPESITQILNSTESTRYYIKYIDEFANLSDGFQKIGLDWQIPGGRPANSPYRRIAGISYLLAREPSLFSRIVEIISNLPVGNIRKELIQLLCIPATGYWATSSTFDSKPFTKEYALIGKERADAIILNIIIPLVFLYSQAEKNNALQKTILELYRSYPKLMDNYYTRFMKHRLFKSDDKITTAVIKTASVQQGLIEIFTDFCKKGYEGCEHCGLMEWLSK